MTDVEPPPPERRGSSLALRGIFTLLLIAAIYLAAPVLIPLTVAIMLSMLLAGPTSLLERAWVPRQLAALFVVTAALFGLLWGSYLLAEPAQAWLHDVPANLPKIERHLRALVEPLEDVRRAAEKLEAAAETHMPASPQKVQVERPGLTELMLSGTAQVAATIGMVIVLTYLLLGAGDSFLRKLVTVIPNFADKKRAVDIVRSIEADISSYLMLVTTINVSLGTIVAFTAAALDVPNPLLWGALTTLLSFAPYLGEAAIAVILSMVGMTTFDQLADALVLPGVYVAVMTAIHVLVPFVLSRRLTLNPVAIFITIIFWGFMWGIPGALIGVPLLASLKIICERFGPLQPIAEFLSS